MGGEVKVVQYAEGTASTGAPTDLFFMATGFKTYANDAAFVSAKGAAAAIGDAYANTTDKYIHFFDGTFWQVVDDKKNNFTAVTDPTVVNDNTQNYQVGSFWVNTTNGTIFIATSVATANAVWLQVGRALVGYREDFSAQVNGTQNTFNFSYTPVDGTIVPLVNGVAVLKTKFSYVHPTLTLTDVPQLGQKLEVQYLTNGTPSIVQIRTDEVVVYRTVSAGEITAKQLTLAVTPIDNTKVKVDVIGGSAQIYNVDFIVTGAILDWNGYNLDGQIIAGSVLRINYYTVI